MIPFPDPRQRLAALAAALFLGCSPAIADEVQEVSTLLKSGQHQQALERINKLLSSKPKDPRARFLKGLILAEQGNPKDATEVFLKLTQDYPDLPEPYNNLAVIYAAQGQYDKARAALEQSIRTHPSYATAYENLGDVYAKLASRAYDKALQIDSANPGAKNKLALVRELVGGTPPPAKPVAGASAQKEPVKAAEVAAAEPKPTAEPKPVPEKPVSAKPADAEVIETVYAWAKAWSAKDVDSYLAFYSKDFKTPNSEPRGDWEKGRRQRISAPKSIAVSVESPKVSLADGQASVTFRQGYRSEVIKSNSTKTLILAKSDGRWLIQQEKVAN